MIYDWIQINATFLNVCSIIGIKKPASNFTGTERHELAVLLQWNLQTEKWEQCHLILQRTKPFFFIITRITNGRDSILNPNTWMKTLISLQSKMAKSLLLLGIRRAFSHKLFAAETVLWFPKKGSIDHFLSNQLQDSFRGTSAKGHVKAACRMRT